MFQLITKAAEATGAAGATAAQNPMASSMNFMMLFNIFIAIYLLYYAIKGSGKAYENDYPKEMKESHAKMLRKFCWITGVGLLILSILEYQQGFNSVWSIISIVFVLSCVVIYVVLLRVRYKEYFSKSKPSKK